MTLGLALAVVIVIITLLLANLKTSFMAFGKNYVFEVFFKLFLGIILYGISHGLVLCPIILSFMNK